MDLLCPAMKILPRALEKPLRNLEALVIDAIEEDTISSIQMIWARCKKDERRRRSRITDLDNISERWAWFIMIIFLKTDAKPQLRPLAAARGERGEARRSTLVLLMVLGMILHLLLLIKISHRSLIYNNSITNPQAGVYQPSLPLVNPLPLRIDSNDHDNKEHKKAPTKP